MVVQADAQYERAGTAQRDTRCCGSSCAVIFPNRHIRMPPAGHCRSPDRGHRLPDESLTGRACQRILQAKVCCRAVSPHSGRAPSNGASLNTTCAHIRLRCCVMRRTYRSTLTSRRWTVPPRSSPDRTWLVRHFSMRAEKQADCQVKAPASVQR